MTEWLKPDKNIVKHDYSVIIYRYEFDGDGEMLTDDDIGIFRFNPITNTFNELDSPNWIKYKDIVQWFPVPKFEIKGM